MAHLLCFNISCQRNYAQWPCKHRWNLDDNCGRHNTLACKHSAKTISTNLSDPLYDSYPRIVLFHCQRLACWANALAFTVNQRYILGLFGCRAFCFTVKHRTRCNKSRNKLKYSKKHLHAKTIHFACRCFIVRINKRQYYP